MAGLMPSLHHADNLPSCYSQLVCIDSVPKVTAPLGLCHMGIARTEVLTWVREEVQTGQ